MWTYLLGLPPCPLHVESVSAPSGLHSQPLLACTGDLTLSPPAPVPHQIRLPLAQEACPDHRSCFSFLQTPSRPCPQAHVWPRWPRAPGCPITAFLPGLCLPHLGRSPRHTGCLALRFKNTCGIKPKPRNMKATPGRSRVAHRVWNRKQRSGPGRGRARRWARCRGEADQGL